MHPRSIAIVAFMLASAGTASAQVGYEVEWHTADLTLVDTSGGTPEGTPFYIKEVLGQVGNWLVTSDDVWEPRVCPQDIVNLFPTIQAFDRDDVYKSTPHAGYCYKGVIEYKSAIPDSTALAIQGDIAQLRTVLTNLRTQPVTTNVNGMGPLDGTNNGCNNTYPCVLKFPYYQNEHDALAGINAVPNLHWYVVVYGKPREDLRPQLNVNVDLEYFAAQKTTNPFLNTQFSELWNTTSGWSFAPITGFDLPDARKGFYRLFGYYASKLDGLAKMRRWTTAYVAGKNTLNPNPKVDFCQLRASFGVSLRTYSPLYTYFGTAGTVYPITNPTPQEVLRFFQAWSCPFTSSDVGLLPFTSDGSIIPLGKPMPVFEFRHPMTDNGCFDLVEYIATGQGNLANLAGQCFTSISTF